MVIPAPLGSHILYVQILQRAIKSITPKHCLLKIRESDASPGFYSVSIQTAGAWGTALAFAISSLPCSCVSLKLPLTPRRLWEL